MCKNYEIELQSEQNRIKSLDNQLAQSRQNVKTQKRIIEDLENQMKALGEDYKKQVCFFYLCWLFRECVKSFVGLWFDAIKRLTTDRERSAVNKLHGREVKQWLPAILLALCGFLL